MIITHRSMPRVIRGAVAAKVPCRNAAAAFRVRRPTTMGVGIPCAVAVDRPCAVTTITTTTIAVVAVSDPQCAVAITADEAVNDRPCGTVIPSIGPFIIIIMAVDRRCAIRVDRPCPNPPCRSNNNADPPCPAPTAATSTKEANAVLVPTNRRAVTFPAASAAALRPMVRRDSDPNWPNPAPRSITTNCPANKWIICSVNRAKCAINAALSRNARERDNCSSAANARWPATARNGANPKPGRTDTTCTAANRAWSKRTICSNCKIWTANPRGTDKFARSSDRPPMAASKSFACPCPTRPLIWTTSRALACRRASWDDYDR
mmetsp:Transcript_21307/g.59001  ORF Transcript_21307/g.59001 Transcript_21307/m.59001 type:complete len:320 (-) Transcript_21307:446-1405(-)